MVESGYLATTTIFPDSSGGRGVSCCRLLTQTITFKVKNASFG